MAAHAQWMTQRINLQTGWNAIHLKVHPTDRSCANVFPAAVTQVSWWNRDRIDDGTGSAITDLCAWYRSGEEPSTFNNVIGDHCYLVYSTASAQVDVTGKPALPRGTIYLGEENLIGLNVPYNAGSDSPTFADYFKDSKVMWGNVSGWPLYRVKPTNDPIMVNGSVMSVTNYSEAFWFATSGDGIKTFTGPLVVSHDRSTPSVTWTDDTEPRTITIENASSDDRTIKIERVSSQVPPTGERRSEGNVELLLEELDWSKGYARRVYKAVDFPFTTNVAAGAVFEFRVKPDLSKMASTDDGDYMSVLQITDAGSTVNDKTFDKGICLYSVGVCSAGDLASKKLSKLAGLWVGTVVLAQVNRAKTLSSAEPEWGSDNLFTAPHTFQFRLLVHVDEDGNANLLKQAFTAMEDPSDDKTYLLADRETAIAFRGEYPNGTIRRTSSANFPFMAPQPLTGGTFMVPENTISATFTQEYDDKTNPFVHAFHPQHDNVEFNNQKPSKLGDGDEGRGEYESWGVTREVSLTFVAEDPVGENVEWNRTVTGGIYEETVTGLTGQGKPIITRGAFRLTKVNDAKTIKSGGSLD
jgi:hypothetical protein